MITIGADPELFLSIGGELVSSYGIVPGSKYNPYAVPFGAVQVAGMALEFNIDPADHKDDFVHNIVKVLSTFRYMRPSI